jgi:hypothetical protein
MHRYPQYPRAQPSLCTFWKTAPIAFDAPATGPVSVHEVLIAAPFFLSSSDLEVSRSVPVYVETFRMLADIGKKKRLIRQDFKAYGMQ